MADSALLAPPTGCRGDVYKITTAHGRLICQLSKKELAVRVEAGKRENRSFCIHNLSCSAAERIRTAINFTATITSPVRLPAE